MNAPLPRPESPDRRRAGGTALAALPAVLVALLVLPLIGPAPGIGDSIRAHCEPLVLEVIDLADAFASAAVDAVTDPEVLVRGLTGNRAGSVSAE